MSAVADAWKLKDAAERPSPPSARVLEFLLFAMLPLAGGIGNIPVPINEAAAVVLVGLASFRQARDATERPFWYASLMFAFLSWLTFSSLDNGDPNWRRIAHMLVFVALALSLSSGRLDRLSAVRGLGLGLGIVIVAGLANQVTPIFGTGYGGRFTGLIPDPNAAGYYLTVLGALAMSGVRSKTARYIGAAGLVLAIVLTLSRTSLLAMLIGVIWLLLRRRFTVRPAIVVLGVMAYAFASIPADLRLWGPFKTRVGSDALRERILDAEIVKVALRPWVGNGAGSSHVEVGGNTFYFHSSYLGLRNESGWIGFALFIALLALVFLALVRVPFENRHPWLEVALIALAVCALNLGEVLLELPVAVALGLAMRHVLAPDELTDVDRGTSNHVF